MAEKKKGGRFANLARQVRGEEEEAAEQKPVVEPEAVNITPTESLEPKKRGRPGGRRSDPNYTQISAYIPLELLHEVQDLLLQERRRKRLRSGVDVSGLVENLLREWVKNQKHE
jgi:hypothetical protein